MPPASSASNDWPRRRAANSTRRWSPAPRSKSARLLLRRHVPKLEPDRKMAPDIEAATDMVTSGALIEAAGAASHCRRSIIEGPPMSKRLDNDRIIRAPRGPVLSAKSWVTEAPMRMLMNNLDPDVAEKPHELVVYGGIGRARARLGELRPHRLVAEGARRRRDAAACSPASRSACSRPMPMRRAC